jgi:hypothetical protein
MKKAPLIFLLLVFIVQLSAAQNIRKKIEKSYRQLSDSDSVLISDKVYEFDYQGRLLSKKEFYFNQQPKGSVSKEINARFDSIKMILEENIYTYKKNDIEHERLKTKYLIYLPSEDDSKYVWRQYYDVTEELMREDTLTYDKAGNLISRMVYDYRGSTSQSSDNYYYDKKNRLKRWQWYTYWATVNAKSKPVTKRDKRQDYKYKYNRKGQLMKVSGKRYSTAFLETYQYDSDGKILKFTQLKTKKSKNSASVRKKENKGKYSITEEKIFKQYKRAYLTLESQSLNGKELKRTEISYFKDSLMSSLTQFQKGVKISELFFEYGNNDLPTKKALTNYVNAKAHTVLESIFDEKGNIILEIKSLNKEELNRNELTYDENFRLKTLKSYIKTKNGNKLFETIQYQYEFY